jgi:hypothetical protein
MARLCDTGSPARGRRRSSRRTPTEQLTTFSKEGNCVMQFARNFSSCTLKMTCTSAGHFLSWHPLHARRNKVEHAPDYSATLTPPLTATAGAFWGVVFLCSQERKWPADVQVTHTQREINAKGRRNRSLVVHSLPNLWSMCGEQTKKLVSGVHCEWWAT